MKKVGIILGVVVLIAVIIIFSISNKITNAKNNNPKVENSPPVVTENIVNNENKSDPIPEPTPVVTPEPEIITETIIKEISGVKTIDESALKNASEIKEVVTIISNKRILLIDENIEGTDNKMLSYCFDVLTPDNKNLLLFITKSVYANYSVGDKLNVTYLIYKNDNNVEFPIVFSVNSVE